MNRAGFIARLRATTSDNYVVRVTSHSRPMNRATTTDNYVVRVVASFMRRYLTFPPDESGNYIICGSRRLQPAHPEGCGYLLLMRLFL